MQIQCTQCGAGVPIEEESAFLRCPYCDTALYLETDRTVKHYSLPAQYQVADLGPLLQRKLSRLEITDPVTVSSSRLLFFPFWRFALPAGGALLLPAANPLVEDLLEIKDPAGELKLFSPDLAVSADFVEPEVLREEAENEAKAAAGLKPKADFSATSLLHLPLYEVTYQCQNKTHRAVVDGATGEVYADDWPATPQKEKNRVLGFFAGLTFTLFLLESALLPGFWLVLGAYLLTGVILFYFARKLLRRMGW